MISFALDGAALSFVIFFCLLGFAIHRYFKNFPRPQIFVGSLDFLHAKPSSWKERFAKLPDQLKWVGIFALLLAFADPRIFIERSHAANSILPPGGTFATQGVAIYLVLDKSGSMAEKVIAQQPDGRLEKLPKIELLKQGTLAFIEGDPALGLIGRPNDLIGLVEFARTANVVVPLTLDRQALIAAVKQLEVVKDPNQDGTAIGYAMLKTTQLIEATRNYSKDLQAKGKPAYEIKNSIIILVTDGLQDPHPADKGSRWRQIDPIAAAYQAKELGIHVYIVNIEPRFLREEFAPHRRLLQKAAEITGGKLFMMGDADSLVQVYATIDALEKSSLPIGQDLIKKLKQKLSKEDLPGLYRTIFLAPYLIAFALLCLMGGIFLECTILRKAP